MYRDDDQARTERATQLIDEIAGLERGRLAQAAADRRLEDARVELAALAGAAPAPVRPPGLVAHALVFGIAAAVAFTGYSLFA